MHVSIDDFDLVARCGVFNEGDNGVPEGWVEIQRFDRIDREFGSRTAKVFKSDAHAACAVARRAGSGALLFDPATGATMMLDTRFGEEGTTRLQANVRTAMERAIAEGDAENEGTTVRWLCIVPRCAAEKAGLLA